MAPPFIALSLAEFAELLDDWHASTGRRGIDAVHMHHTWRPNHAQYRGHETIVGMWRHHTRSNGWSDIAQHLTIAPDGTLWTGRHWNQPPASSGGHNGNPRSGPFMYEMIGDFDAGKDSFADPQANAALWVTTLLLRKFGLTPHGLKFHNQLGSPKTCPGSAIDHGAMIKEIDKRWEQPLPAPAGRAARTAAGFDALAEGRRWLAASPAAAVFEDATAEPRHDGAPSAAAAPARAARAAQPDEFDTATAALLRPHVINLEGGKLSRDGAYTTTDDDLQRIFEVEIPRRIAEAQGRGEPLRLVLYAHGGLVDEKKGLLIAANQIGWWNANHVYPLQFVWETGLLEELGRHLLSGRARGETSDWLLETATRGFGSFIWRGIKADARAAFERDGGGRLVVARLTKLLRKYPEALELHAVGHSAGAIFQSWLVPELARATKRPVKSLTLLAPAITVADYQTRLDAVSEAGTAVTIFTMAKDYELADGVAGIYGKSLLYLVSRAYEPERDTPILGLEESLRGDRLLRRRFGLDGRPGDGDVVFSVTEGTMGRSESHATKHGGFDNDDETMDSMLRRILGLPDAATLPLPYPADRVSRSVTPTTPDMGPPTATAPAPPPPAAVADTAGRTRRALCIGINLYPHGRDELGGCVADAQEWAKALGAHGFAVETLFDAAATRDAILARLTALIGAGRAGDSLVFQYAGHGAFMPDDTGDEDDGRDETICPVDFRSGAMIIDDDMRAIFDKMAPGVGLTCFFDSCHSGTVTRLAVGDVPDRPAGSRPRFVKATAELIASHRAFRAGLPAGRGTATRNDLRWVTFSAASPIEEALENNGRGDYSRRAVPLLARPGLTNRAFADAVTEAFGPQPKQTPNLDCPDALAGGRLLFLDATMPAPAAAPRGTNAEVATLLERAAALLRAG